MIFGHEHMFLMTTKLWFGSFRREGLAQISSSSSQHILGSWAWRGRWVFPCLSRRKGWFRNPKMCDLHCENWQSKLVMHCQVKYNSCSSQQLQEIKNISSFPSPDPFLHVQLLCVLNVQLNFGFFHQAFSITSQSASHHTIEDIHKYLSNPIIKSRQLDINTYQFCSLISI